ncbi:hypothetical protein DRN97_06530 [Methanosarcinales archaeon]|nr:MAG: hypothetical protein DRN97_06530 [Methanosarcinales archaeon]
MEGIYLNGWTDLDEAQRKVFKSKEEAKQYISKHGGAFVFEEEGERKVIRSADERGVRSILLGKAFGWI